MRAAEEQKQSATALETVPQSDSTPVKKQHGSKRPGAADGCLAKLL